MATESIDIRIRAKGAAATGRKIKKIGTESRKASSGVKLLIGALAGFSIVGFLRAGEAIEDTKIALKGLLGSMEAANKAFNAIDVLATDVKQGINELSGAFVILTSANIGTIKNLALAADVATVFKRSTEDVARALFSLETETLRNAFGFDQVAKAGENYTAKLNGVLVAQGDSRNAFRQSILDYVETSRFAGAAAGANEAFGTGLSTIANQINKLSAAIREALGPGLATVALNIKEVTTELLELIETNKADVFGSVLDAFADAATAGADVAEILESIGVNTTLISNQFTLLQKGFAAFFSSIGTGFQLIRTSALALISVLADLGNALGFVSDEAKAKRLRAFDEATIDLAKSAEGTQDKLLDFGKQIIKNAKSILDFNKKTDTASGFLDDLAESARRAKRDLKDLREEQEKGQAVVEEGSLPPPPGGFLFEGGAEPARDALNPFGEEDLTFAGATAAGSFLDGLIRSKELMGAGDEAGETFGDQFAEYGARVVRSVLTSALRSDAIEFGDILADLAAQALEESLQDVLKNIFDQLGGAGDQLAGAEGSGGGFDFGKALGTLALVGSVVQAGLKKTSSSARQGLASSAVTDVQETRGLIAGAQNVPIQKIGDDIQDAFVPLLVVAESELATLQSILLAIRAQGTGDAATASLDGTLTSELNGSTSLA